MFDDFKTVVTMSALTLGAIKQVTGLEWTEVDLEQPEIPAEKGVYVWVGGDAPHPLFYHGSGSGAGGLRARLGNQLGWRANQRAALAAVQSGEEEALTEQAAWDLAREVPAVQQAAAEGQRLFIAVASPAPWTVDRSEIAPPVTAIHWEAFISAVSLLVTGHRGLVGGGAWESKAGTIASLMTDLAWDRLVDLHEGDWT